MILGIAPTGDYADQYLTDDVLPLRAPAYIQINRQDGIADLSQVCDCLIS